MCKAHPRPSCVWQKNRRGAGKEWEVDCQVDCQVTLEGLENIVFYCFHDQFVPGVGRAIQDIRDKGIGFSMISGDKHSRCLEVATQLGLFKRPNTTNTTHPTNTSNVNVNAH